MKTTQYFLIAIQSPANGAFVLAKVTIAFGIVFEESIPENMRRQRCFLNIPFDVRALDVHLQRPNDGRFNFQ